MQQKKIYLECEKRWVYWVLMIVAGFYGGYAMMVRGGVFSNAQTGNVAFMAVALGQGHWKEAAYYLIPISAYLLGSLVSEVLPKPLRRLHVLRWDTLLTLFEIVAVVVMGFIPVTAPHQICQVLINFICAMQYNTFRQSEGVSMATTFVTNHIRQLGISLTGLFNKDSAEKRKLRQGSVHLIMILFFVLGVAAATVASRYLQEKAIWCALVPLIVLFVDLLHADLTKEKALLEQTPAGH